VTSTLLGLGGFPASHPLSLGMMGMHGEAWVNASIQNRLLIALGMRFDDRVTGKLATYAVHAKKIHAEIDPSEINKNVRVDVALPGDVRSTLEALVPAVQPRTRKPGWSASARSAARRAAATCNRCPRAESCSRLTCCTILWRLTEGKALVVTDAAAPDVGSPVLQARSAALADHLRRLERWVSRSPRHGRPLRPPERRDLVVAGDAASR